jgi:hypothetical protein
MKTLAALVAAMLILAHPLASSATEPQQTHQQGAYATAQWDYVEGDVITGVQLSLFFDQAVYPRSDGPVPTPFLTFSIFRVNLATGEVFDGLVESTDFQFTIDKDLSTARLTAPLVYLLVNNENVYEASVDLQWQATSEVRHFVQAVHSPGGNATAQEVKEVDAVASGSIFANGTEFTPVPSTSARLQEYKYQSVTAQ